ncbi:ATP-dependent DNA helicase PIF1 [Paramuricea clavata]|uniref:ATP-dependent DNA helicase PIF1 n=1 Tax=Paramuricea clavata TaxID=317549 RepID=A0A6S7H765_PARCT|nr:ATP-dependent DNA helicase PIF1 [Paramuricea clavata]
MCVAEISKSVPLNEEEESHALKVSDMGPDGRGKIRYLGGWATHKLLEKSRRYVVENRYSTSREVLDKVIKEMKKITLLEDNVVVSSQFMQETSEVPEILQVTESRQYRERGLLNISDSAYEFFLLLEQHRNDHINFNRLAQLGSDLIDDSVASVTRNEVVQNMFLNLFWLDNAEERVGTES